MNIEPGILQSRKLLAASIARLVCLSQVLNGGARLDTVTAAAIGVAS